MKVAVLFAEGFEEIEAVTPVDVLKRAGLDVVMVGLDNSEVCGSHGIVFKMDCLLEDIFADDLDMLVLPGGLPGSYNLRDSDEVIDLVCDLHALKKYIAAICAAPLVLEKAGILEDKKVTSYPAMEDEMTSCEEYTASRVEVDGNIITSRGAGCSFEFSFALLEVLGMAEKAAELKKAMIV